MKTRSLTTLLLIASVCTTFGATAAPVITRADLFTDVFGANATFGLAAGNYLHLDTTATSTSATGRGCVKTQNPRVFGGPFTPPEVSIVEYRAI